MSFYFDKFEARRPPAPVPYSPARELVQQALSTAAVVLGAWYLVWRWTSSLNWAVPWFSLPLVAAETLAFVGSILFFLNAWRTRDTPVQAPPAHLSEILADPPGQDRPLAVDVFFPTYGEELELVRLSVRDAKAIRYPHPIDLRIHVLDDGRRADMKALAAAEGCQYHTRSTNTGYKAGNLRNALENSSGDILVICDADTRPFPELLERTLGYFRDPKVAWVQTPQWFYDLDEGTPLPEWLADKLKLGPVGRWLGRLTQRLIGPVQIGADPLGNDPVLFYDVIQRRRNWCNASFCCGAGSIHRREAVMETALKAWSAEVDASVKPHIAPIDDKAMRDELDLALTAEAAREIEMTPYKFHVSEDLYTSIVLHSDPDRQWRSVFHPEVLSKMLSPQDLVAWTIQRFKYCGGTLDIFWNDNPLRKRLSPWQKVMYASTIYSYLAPLWTGIFLAAPILSLWLGVTPLAAYNLPFYAHLLPFLFVNKLALMLATWGVPAWRGEQYYLAFFALNWQAIKDVLAGKPIKFKVTPKTRESGRKLGLVKPQLWLAGACLGGIVFAAVRVFHFEIGQQSALFANAFWALNNVFALSAIILAAAKRPTEEPS